MKCAVIIPVGPGHEYLAEDSVDSVRDAFAKDPGPFSEMTVIRIDDTQGVLGRSAARNKGVADARAQGADWIFFLDADDLMDPGAFGVMGGYHADFDAVWGLICELSENEETYTVRHGQLPSIDRLEQLLANDPALTLQMGHFVRAGIAAETPFNVTLNCGEDFDYYLRLWTRYRCRKVATPLFINRRGFHSTGPRSATGRQWREAVQSILRTQCQITNLLCEFQCEGEVFRFRIVDPFDQIQRDLLRGKFNELAEMSLIRDRVKRGAVVLDIGAKTGSRAVYLARFLEPARIVLVEPDTKLLETLEYNLSVNGVTVADTRLSRSGDGTSQFALGLSSVVERNNGDMSRTTQLPQVARRLEFTDALVGERVDLIVVDREGLALEALESLEHVINRFRPSLLVSLSVANHTALDGWCQENAYGVVRRFEHPSSVRVYLEAGRQD